jgi:septal ring factor EnvC (AmiA/AmiB activator)
MLQNMQTRIQAEGKKEADIFDKYMCYCKNSGGDLSKSIGDANVKIPQLGEDIKADEAAQAQLKEDLKQAQVDRAAAKEAVATATALREKEAAAYAKESSELNANIAALEKATAAIEKGMAGAFLQTHTADVLKRIVQKSENFASDADREQLMAFLSGSQGEDYAPQSGQIVGILKTMHDEMSAALADATGAENEAIKAYDALMASKTKEINALTKSIETKMARSGNLAVKITQMKNDLEDTEQALIEDQAFLRDLEKNCATKQSEYDQMVATRNEELVALAETIKVLNDDDALELFKKTLPSSASSSFVQVKVSSVTTRAHALAAVRKAKQAAKNDDPRLDFIAMAIQGKKIGFEKVIAMIDDMVKSLKVEQQDDDNKKEYCATQFDLSDDKKKGLERSISDLETSIQDAEEGIATTKADIAALQDSIKALDKSVAAATEQRQEENQDFQELIAADSAASELLAFARNRLNKFYNPKLYKAAPERVLSAEDRATLAAGGTLAPTPPPGGIANTGIAVLADINEHRQGAAPPPPPQAASYAKKTQESTGVITMINLLISDLDKEMAEAKATEKDSQADYETMMKASAAKRAGDSKSLADKEKTLADLQASLQASGADKASAGNELKATNQYISALHNECDWLLKYFDVRKDARASEVDALGKAKAVLSGADFSLMQVGNKRFLQ